jgi:hypothetical protein
VWGLSHADSGGATWPVTAAYVAAAGSLAVGNVWLIGLWRHRRHHA